MRTDVPLLTKSDYMAGLQCPKKLYLKKYFRELEAPYNDAAKARMAEGIEVGHYARLAFPSGVLVSAGIEGDPIAVTASLMATADVIFEPQFVSTGRTVRVDVLQRTYENRWHVIEVKSSKAPKEGEGPKEPHLEDLAYQVLVLREAGLDISKASLMLLSRSFTADENSPDPTALFEIIDCTSAIEPLLPGAQSRSLGLLHMLARDTAPTVETNTYCAGCGFHGHCHVDQPEHDLVFLPRIKAAQVTELRQQGFRTIGEIPNSFKLSPTQMRVRNVVRGGSPYIDERLGPTLESMKYPMYFIDFEATKWAIPNYPGTESHQAIPFQWSCHVLERPQAELVHLEFLHRKPTDPRHAFAETLWNTIKGAGSIFVYSSYEWTTVKALAKYNINFASELCALLAEKSVDLLKIVQDCIYLQDFNGGYSIKQVLPAMVPGMSYADLAIREGETASAEYKRMIHPATSPEESAHIADNLLAYCKRDTEAMVALFHAMAKLCGDRPEELPNAKLPSPDDTQHSQLALGL
jgi:CRISPR/Cas system-associated exonuclease Cas4 (RecB family)